MGVPSGLNEEELNWEDQAASQLGGCDCGTAPDPRQQYTTEIPHTCRQIMGRESIILEVPMWVCVGVGGVLYSRMQWNVIQYCVRDIT